MSIKPAFFPNSVWNGLTESRLDLTIFRNPDGFDFDRLRTEVVSLETYVLAGAGGAFLQIANNLSDLASAATARTNLGLGAVATLPSIDLTADVAGILPTANGGTGAASLASAGIGAVSGDALAGLVLSDIAWNCLFDGDSNVGADGTGIASWANTYGSADAAVQSSASLKPLNKTGANGLNGHSVALFDGTDDYLATTLGGWADAPTGAFWMVALAKNTATTGDRILFSVGDQTSLHDERAIYYDANGKMLGYADHGSALSYSYNLGTTAYHLIEILFNPARAYLGVYVDGVMIGESYTTVLTGTFSTTVMTLGGNPNHDNMWKGNIAWVGAMKNYPTTAQRLRVYGYLNTRFGLALPDSLVTLPKFATLTAPGIKDGPINFAGSRAYVEAAGGVFGLTGAGTFKGGSDATVNAYAWTVESAWNFNGNISAYAERGNEHLFVADSPNNVAAFWNVNGVCAARYLSNAGWECFAAGFTGPEPPSGGIAFVEASNFKTGQTTPGQFEVWQTVIGTAPHVRMRFRRDTFGVEIQDWTALTNNGPAANAAATGLVFSTGTPVTAVANNGTLDTTILTGVATCCGLLVVKDSTNGKCGVYRLENTTLTSVSADAEFSTILDNATTVNVYANSGKICLQNKTGGSLNLTASYYGA